MHVDSLRPTRATANFSVGAPRSIGSHLQAVQLCLQNTSFLRLLCKATLQLSAAAGHLIQLRSRVACHLRDLLTVALRLSAATRGIPKGAHGVLG